MKEICAVVLSFNRVELLKKCVDAVLNQRNIDSDVLIIDNGEQKEVAEIYGNNAIDGVLYYRPNSNCGCAGGFNLGIRKAIEIGYRYIWTLDDDSIPCEDALYELMESGKKIGDNWGILSSVAFCNDGKLCKANIQKKGVFTFLKGSDYKFNSIEVMMVSWASMLIRSEVVYDVGLPISDYFVYSDDYEFSARISNKYSVYVIPRSRVVHEISINKKANIVFAEGERLERFKYLYRNDVHFYKRFGVKGIIYIISKCIATLLYIAVKEKNDKIGKIKILCDSVCAGISFDPKIELLRKA
jgi:GT2 family glycosyltransferase